MCYNTRRLTDVETIRYNAAKLILRFDRLIMKANDNNILGGKRLKSMII